MAGPKAIVVKLGNYSHHVGDVEETYKWRNITIAATVGCVGMIFNTFSGEEHHEPHERPVIWMHVVFSL